MKKASLGLIRKEFEDNGCTLLEGHYSSNVQPLSYRCVCGMESVTTLARFRRGSRCKDCGTSKAAKKKRGRDIQSVRILFAERGMECLELEYENNYTPMNYKCQCGRVSKIRLFCLLKGQRCDGCDPGRGTTHYRWMPDRAEVLLRRRVRSRYGHLVRSVMKSLGISKKYKSAEILGYARQELLSHLQSFPDWETISKGKWHIDHVFPIKAFIDHGIHDVRLVNCLDNLRPLSAFDNMSKNDKYDEKAFKEWVTDHLLDRSTSNVKSVMKGDLDLIIG